ncbi:MAG: sulfite exporter TauE/SafE family protein [Gemmatimonadota bacterium]|nr:sulfite exporter TauE/SafE family protein [Gemmatimonadota bacterium]MDQ6872564.1 sulfite exporter TauE/SafE family protein [Gemmatimonadota bacterium]
MSVSDTLIIAFLFLAAAALYASVGHAGASAYLAVMGLYNFAPAVMRPTALALNILVAAVATIKFYRAGLFSWSLLWPFAAASIPAALVGGAITLPARWYHIVVGVVLLYAAAWMFRSAFRPLGREPHPPPLWAALVAGLLIGFLSGLTGVGGGIFLSPLLLSMGWAETRATSSVAAPFILVNSIAGFLGHFSSVSQLPANIPVWSVAAVLGGWIGATYGSKRAPAPVLRQLLSLVLIVAGVKMILY